MLYLVWLVNRYLQGADTGDIRDQHPQASRAQGPAEIPDPGILTTTNRKARHKDSRCPRCVGWLVNIDLSTAMNHSLWQAITEIAPECGQQL
ncbi:MAG TPA: hypothetical protein EYP93_05005 [Gammaproteobacteria bacterium]|nr:hypothetical protein [Gammaproteobacteria bacterium]